MQRAILLLLIFISASAHALHKPLLQEAGTSPQTSGQNSPAGSSQNSPVMATTTLSMTLPPAGAQGSSSLPGAGAGSPPQGFIRLHQQYFKLPDFGKNIIRFKKRNAERQRKELEAEEAAQKRGAALIERYGAKTLDAALERHEEYLRATYPGKAIAVAAALDRQEHDKEVFTA